MKTQVMRLICREPSPVGGSSPWLRSPWRVPATCCEKHCEQWAVGGMLTPSLLILLVTVWIP